MNKITSAFMRLQIYISNKCCLFFYSSKNLISEDHVTLKTGVMAAENSALPSQKLNIF